MRRWTVALIALVLSFVAPLAHAEAPTPLPQPSLADSNAVGACLAADQVWLFVVDADQRVLANQCVGTPANGEQALRDAGVVIEYGRNDLICTLAGYPEECPSSFDGSFWNYHHASLGEGWRFSDLGAASYEPQPGSIEGWCYNGPDDNRCEPPHLRVVIDGELHAPPGVAEDALADPELIVRAPVPPPSPLPLATILSVAALVLLGGMVAVVFRRRRRFVDDESSEFPTR